MPPKGSFTDAGRAGYRLREQRKREAFLNGGFVARIDSSRGPNACWPWTGSLQTTRFGRREGYGVFTIAGKVRYAHRQALAHALGRPLAPGMEALHSCDNPPCCNPAHLREGTHAENVADMWARGRGVRSSRLTPDQVIEIRDRLAAGDRHSDIGQAFGVARTTVSSIAQGRNWGTAA